MSTNSDDFLAAKIADAERGFDTQRAQMQSREAKERTELRDRFAMAALANMAAGFNDLICKDIASDHIKKVSRIAYLYADAMLAAREAPPERARPTLGNGAGAG